MKKKKYLLPFLILGLGVLIRSVFQPQPDLTVMGFVNIRDGLGRQPIELIEALEKDLKVNFISTSKTKTKYLDEITLKSLKKATTSKQWGKVIVFEDNIWCPDRKPHRKIIKSNPSSIRLAYSMWETSKIPPEWVAILNRHFDAVLVPAPFLVDVYKNSGVQIPIFELPLALNLKTLLEQPLKETNKTPMVFGNLSSCMLRKNQITFLRAFAKAFGNDPSVTLRINSRYGVKDTIEAFHQEVHNLGLNNVIFTQFSLSPEDYLYELKNIDCYVSPSKGEGFSIQPREAMILGIPVIATNNTGQIPLCESGLVKTVSSEITQTAHSPWGAGYYGNQYNCDIDELASALIDMKENYNDYLNQKENARKWASQYDYDNLKPLYKSVVKPQTITLGTENKITPTGLVTNSKELYEKYKAALKL